ncbi:unnamed protein product [Sphagnum jensenii]|uniref:Fungal lipase-type domain-containing protein n=1 Tax=Sphagnum jensenii TaxID=128206 RepID=A0ABP1AHR5_9BRYO
MLMYIGESKISDKLEAVYTFGQPRVGDEGFKKYGNEKLGDSYFHIVYSHDFVARIPFDSKCLKYKQFGKCIYYDSAYNAKILDEISERNYFNRRMYRNHRAAFSELRRPAEYSKMSERFFDIGSKLGGLIFPGSSAHYMRNYVTAVQETLIPLPKA